MIYLKDGRNVKGERIELLINNDIIEAISINFDKDIEKLAGKHRNLKIINLEGKTVMPGVIDIHTHMRDPGITEKEDFETGSRGCAKGGITTFYDMPNTIPPTTSLESLMEKKEIAGSKSIVNFGFHFGGSRNDNIKEIKEVLSRKEGNTVKIFMNVTTGEMLIEDDNILERVFENSGLVLVHAENEMIDKALKLNREYGRGLYICHISSEEELLKVIKAKEDTDMNSSTHPVYAEVTPHHLFLNEEIREKDEVNRMLLRMKPELKKESDNEFLWKALNEGYVDTVGTDHAPHLISEKLEKVTFGMPGVETSLALMLDAASKGRTSLEKIQEVMCENPAEIMKIHRRGKLNEGYFADIIVVDLEKEWTVGKDDSIESRCGWTPYENWKLKGKNVLTIVNGNIIYENGEIKENVNKGREVEFYE